MTDFNDFAAHLFPDLGTIYHANPGKLPKDVSDLLDLVSCGTGVPKDWLAKSARLVLDGLAGARCLWYLHGCEGEIVGTETEIEPGRLAELRILARKAESDWLSRPSDRAGLSKLSAEIDPDWAAGVVAETYTYTRFAPHSTPVYSREIRLGKWLRKHGASPELIKAFETRQLPVWQWKISTHPFDVLTMSFNRPWTSCMAPGGAAELGPLTDMAAGTAVVFFYRPGAAKPCGRWLLRPAVVYESEEDFGIVDGGRTYGSGPRDLGLPSELEEMLFVASGHRVAVYPQANRTRLCEYGHNGEALTRYIYSDTDRAYCQQTDEQYAEAYARLQSAPWPPSRLDIGDMGDRARGLRELVTSAGGRLAVLDIVREETEAYFSGMSNGDFELTMTEYAKNAGRIADEIKDRVYPRAVEDVYRHQDVDLNWSDDQLDVNNQINDVIQEITERRNEYDVTFVVLAHTDYLSEEARADKEYRIPWPRYWADLSFRELTSIYRAPNGYPLTEETLGATCGELLNAAAEKLVSTGLVDASELDEYPPKLVFTLYPKSLTTRPDDLVEESVDSWEFTSNDIDPRLLFSHR